MNVTMTAIKYIAGCFTAIAMAGTLTEISVAASPASDPGSSRANEEHKETVLGYLRPALLAAKKAGRLYYVVPCNDPDDDLPVPFPEVNAQAPLNNHSGLEAVRDIFRDDKRVTISEESNGLIRVRVGQMPGAILRTKIPLLRLSPLQQYDTTSAIFALTDAKAVQAAMHKQGLREVASVFSIARNLPAKPAPHLPAVIKNVTLDQALDMVARTFRVIVVFGECTNLKGPKFMFIDTVDL